MERHGGTGPTQRQCLRRTGSQRGGEGRAYKGRGSGTEHEIRRDLSSERAEPRSDGKGRRAWDEEAPIPGDRALGVGVNGVGRGKGEIGESGGGSGGKRNLRRFHAWRVVERGRPGLLVARKAAASRLTAAAHYIGRGRDRDGYSDRWKERGGYREAG